MKHACRKSRLLLSLAILASWMEVGSAQQVTGVPGSPRATTTFDVGVDTRTGVDDSYELPFRFTGKLDKLTFNLGREQVTAEDREVIKRALAVARD